jgi:peptide/nickel transport system ATP-binding protein
MLHAVDDVDLTIASGEIVAVVGESGSGKSTLARLLALLYKPTSGEIFFDGAPVHTLRLHRRIKPYRSSVQLVFQDPFSLAHPFYRASHGIMRALKLHRPELGRQARVEVAKELLAKVGLTPAEEFLLKRPFELSGGQLQRFGFAQALACEPRLVLADEPVSMLDVSIRIGVLNLMDDLRKRSGLTFLYITHDIASACYLADRVIVMYGGHIVETATVEGLLGRAKHPYTQLLLSAVPDPRLPTSTELPGARFEPPQVIDPGEGCRFRDRCPVAIAECSTVTPRLRMVGRMHEAACHVAIADSDVSTTARAG